MNFTEVSGFLIKSVSVSFGNYHSPPTDKNMDAMGYHEVGFL